MLGSNTHPRSCEEMGVRWIRDRGLTLLLMAMFLLFLVGQFAHRAR